MQQNGAGAWLLAVARAEGIRKQSTSKAMAKGTTNSYSRGVAGAVECGL
jgi:hypothetical protein